MHVFDYSFLKDSLLPAQLVTLAANIAGLKAMSAVRRRENAEAFRIIVDGEPVGGVVVAIHPETQVNSLYLLFVSPDCHSRGIGQTVWRMIEEKYPETKVWETHTPYFEKRNIHFYVNKCGFHIVEFYNPHHPEPREETCDTPRGEYFFRFEKVMK